jgi:hypothetical protein
MGSIKEGLTGMDSMKQRGPVSRPVARRLRIMEKGLYKFAVCERCNSQFKSSLRYHDAAENEIKMQFDDHKCKPMDISQNALRTVHESTEDR